MRRRLLLLIIGSLGVAASVSSCDLLTGPRVEVAPAIIRIPGVQVPDSVQPHVPFRVSIPAYGALCGGEHFATVEISNLVIVSPYYVESIDHGVACPAHSPGWIEEVDIVWPHSGPFTLLIKGRHWLTSAPVVLSYDIFAPE